MHDGQNLFDEATSYAGEWGVDETLNRLAAPGGDAPAFIVVGIDNGGEKRMNELSPWPNKQYGDAEGEAYMRFIVEHVKPLIDTTYRTLPGREHTAIIGSSMGGLISHYAVIAFPDTFSKAGILSPSYWFADGVYKNTAATPPRTDARLYLLMGDKEGDRAIEDMRKMEAQLKAQGHPPENITANVAPGEHNEAFWQREFEAVVRFLFDL